MQPISSIWRPLAFLPVTLPIAHTQALKPRLQSSPTASVCLLFSHSVVSDCLRPHGLYSIRLLSPWNSLSKNTGVGCLAFLQRIFPTPGSNLHLLHWPADSLPMSHLETLIGAQLVYNVVLVSAVKQRESAIHTHTSRLLDFLPI